MSQTPLREFEFIDNTVVEILENEVLNTLKIV